MSEVTVKLLEDPSGSVVCSACGMVLGFEVDVAGVERLLLGGVVVQSAHGACSLCGKEFHWSLSEKKLEQLIHLVRDMKNDS